MDSQMNDKPTIVLLGDFPYWVLDPAIPRPKGHYAVWLVALHEALRSITIYNFHWVCFCKGVRKPFDARHGNQVFHVLPSGSLAFAERTGYLWDKIRVKKLLRKLSPRLLHAWGTESRYAACAAHLPYRKMLSMQGILTAYHERCPLPPYLYRQSRRERTWLPQFDLITSESEWGCERCREISPNSRIERWEYAAEERFFHKTRSLSAHATCLMAGTDTPIKNLSAALRAFATPGLANVTLLIAGVSPDSQRKFPPNVRALGRVGREQMAELLSSAWALIHPSLADTSPNIVKEARVMGLPVITTTECGGAQYIEHGKSGFIISPRDTDSLAQAVTAVTQNRETASTMGAHGQEECRRLLSREIMIERLMSLYHELLQ